MVDVLLGLQWGDEGKGKLVDFLCDGYDIVARFQGGPNAGHSLKIDGKNIVLNTIPSGIFRPSCINLVGNGVVIDPIRLIKEIEVVNKAGGYCDNLFISNKAHLILPGHLALDAASEKALGDARIGSTLRGISPAYQDKYRRSALRIGDIFSPDFESTFKKIHERHLESISFLGGTPPDDISLNKWFEAIEQLRLLNRINGEYYINNAIKEGKKVLAEGAQGTLLDIDFGTFPYVTSSNTITAGACSGLGIAPSLINRVLGVFKAYCTRVGSGPFPTELDNETGEWIRKSGNEFGATTGRPRRTGWLDLVALRYAVMLNGVTDLMMTKSDVLNDLSEIGYCENYIVNNQISQEFPYSLYDETFHAEIKTVHGWDNSLSQIQNFDSMPTHFLNYIRLIESYINLPVNIISTGPEREKTFISETFYR